MQAPSLFLPKTQESPPSALRPRSQGSSSSSRRPWSPGAQPPLPSDPIDPAPSPSSLRPACHLFL